MTIQEAMREVRMKNRQAERRKGVRSEDFVDNALDLLAKNGQITTFWHGSYQEDQDGVDFRIQMVDGTEKDLQVKSSLYYMTRFKIYHPFIPCIVVNPDENITSLSKRLWYLIR